MARTITETIDDLNSIEVTQDAKGQFKYTIKVYFSEYGERLATDRIEKIFNDLKERFEPDNDTPLSAA